MYTPSNKYQYEITDRLGTYNSDVLGEGSATVDFSANTGPKLDYNNEMNGTITFRGEDFQRFLRLERSQYRCDTVGIILKRRCEGSDTFVPWFSGVISMNDGNFDEELCQVSFKITVVDNYSAWEAGKGQDYNIFQLVSVRRSLRMAPSDVVIETVTYQNHTSGTGPGIDCSEYWDGVGEPRPQGWRVFGQNCVRVGIDNEGVNTVDWAREAITLPCTVDPGASWILAQNDCATLNTRKWVRPPTVYGCTYTYGDTHNNNFSYNMECKVVGLNTEASVSQIDNGVLMYDLLLAMLQEMQPTIQVVSDFFQWNPDAPSDNNYVTGAKSKTKHLLFFQKSDVKRPNSSQASTRGMITPQKLVEGLCNIFNCGFWFEVRAGVPTFRIEHVSRRSRIVGMDLNQPRYAKYIKGARKWSYDKAKIPAKEEFKLQEASTYGDFPGLPILYNNGCVSKEGKDQVKTYALDYITTDLQLVLSNPAADSKVVSDQGFFLAAADLFGTDYVLITEPAILSSQAEPNNSLAWAQLHRDYWKYNRPLRSGTMNGEETVMLTVVPTKKGVRIEVPFCCSDYLGTSGVAVPFSPFNQVLTPLGTGIVDTASISLHKDTIALDLLYAANEDLEQNTPPVATNNAYSIYNDGDAKFFNPAADDADPDSDPITSLEILSGPSHGTAVVLPDLRIQYTPTALYVGNDFIFYRIRDSWDEPSNTAVVTITVREPNTPPVANDDLYMVDKNTPLTRPAPGVFANDDDDVAFELDTYDTTGTEGGTLVLNTNGSFTYTPDTGFLGDDLFTYTIKDELDQTDTATITFRVREANAPTSVDDQRATAVNRQLTLHADDSVMNNDFGPVAFQTVAASGATTAGGTYQIFASGIFVYNPPAGFTGQDTFQYTIQNTVGTPYTSDPATVRVRVHPLVYARLTIQNIVFRDIMGDCGSGQQSMGYQREATIRVSYYANAGLTIPLDVTAFNMRVRISDIEEHYEPGGPNPNELVYYRNASGTYTDIGTNFIIDYVNYDCQGNTIANIVHNFTLLPLSSYQII